MSPESKQSGKAVTLEDLLRLKRAERPAPEFWAQFDDALRAKQLAAIVERRPWWRVDLGAWASALSRVRVPVGLAAVGLLSVLTVQQFRSPTAVTPVGPVTDADPSTLADVAMVSEAPQVATLGGAESSGAQGVVVAVAQVNAGPEWVAAGEALAADTSSAALERGPVASAGAAEASLSLNATALASDLRSLRPAPLSTLDSSGVATLELGSFRSNSRTSAVEEPLARVTSPTESRRERLAALVAPAAMKSSSQSGSPDRVRERMISRLSEDELYSSVSRLNVERGGLRVSF